jgi:hypothetical protein
MPYSDLTDADLLRGIAKNSEAIAEAAKSRLDLIEGRVTADDPTQETLIAATIRLITDLRREIDDWLAELKRRHL